MQSDEQGRAKINRGEPLRGSSKAILEQLRQTEHGEHNILIYPDIETLNEVMAAHYKEALDDRNELALFVNTYQPQSKIRQVLGRCGLDVARYENEGSLVIYDGVKGYQSADGVYAVMALINMLLFERVDRLCKAGMVGMADMGSFFMMGDDRLEGLMSYELSLPSVWDKMKLRSFCLYHQEDFERLSGEERQALIDHHYRYVKLY
ncbi:MEDS domain-containing protein [Nitrososphaera sp.]|uniref:MEDS domain-containing protein n=1 Tax=Nitrososphaera sp. TaxID=1971748 RepID=UPI00307E2244